MLKTLRAGMRVRLDPKSEYAYQSKSAGTVLGQASKDSEWWKVRWDEDFEGKVMEHRFNYRPKDLRKAEQDLKGFSNLDHLIPKKPRTKRKSSTKS